MIKKIHQSTLQLQLKLIYLLRLSRATQNFIAQTTHSFIDSLGSIVYSVVQSHKMVFPAMNSGMYFSAANLRNLIQLTNYGVQVYELLSGMLACNTTGIGRA